MTKDQKFSYMVYLGTSPPPLASPSGFFPVLFVTFNFPNEQAEVLGSATGMKVYVSAALWGNRMDLSIWPVGMQFMFS